jgi:hypothetical protein
VAVDDTGHVLSSTNPAGGIGAWATASNVDTADFGLLHGITCPSASLCVANDEGANVVTSTDPTGGTGAWTTTLIDDAAFGTVSCPSTTLCVALDDRGQVLTSTNPTGGAGAWTKALIDPDSGFSLSHNMSCPSISLCIGADADGNLLTSTNPTGGAGAWTLTPNIDHGSSFFEISCPSTSLCIALDGTGNILTSTDPTGGPSAWVPTSNVDEGQGLWTGSCFSISLCLGADQFGGVIASTNPTGDTSAWTTSKPDGVNFMTGVACEGTFLCVAIDNVGNLVVGTPSGEEDKKSGGEEKTGGNENPGGGGTGGSTTGGGTTGGNTGSTGSTGTGSTGGATATVSSVQLLSSLDSQLLPTDKGANIASLLKAGSFLMPFTSLEAGTVSVGWYEVPAGAKLAKKSKAKPVLVASGHLTFAAAGKGTIKIQLTSAGKKLLKHAKILKLTAKGTFTPTGKAATVTTKTFSLKGGR